MEQLGPGRPATGTFARRPGWSARSAPTQRRCAVTLWNVESTGLGDDVEKWLASGTDVRRLAVPASTLDVPGLGPMLILAVVGWPDSITVLTVEPGLGVHAKHANV